MTNSLNKSPWHYVHWKKAVHLIVSDKCANSKKIQFSSQLFPIDFPVTKSLKRDNIFWSI